MTPELAKAALVFLSRAQLQGTEVHAFITVCQALEALAAPPVAPPAEKPE